MYSCKNFISLSVLCLYEGELLGVVNKLHLDKKLKKVVEIELVGTDGAKLILPTKNIYKIGKHAITVKNNQAVNLKVDPSELLACPTDSKAYTINGEFLGVIQEIKFNNKFITQEIVLDNGTCLDVKNLVSCGRNTIIFYDSEKRIDVRKLSPAKNEEKKELEEPVIQDVPDQIEKTAVKEPLNKSVINSEFLVGRICLKDILNFNNEVIIKAHTLVTKKNLKEIKKFGKLRELMLFTK